MKFSELIEIWKNTGLEFHEVVLTNEMMELGRDPEATKNRLKKLLTVMIEEAEKNFGKKFETLTGLTGTNAEKFANYSPKLLSQFNHIATVTALSMGESNASMGRIVACPTAGSCGVMPGVFYAIYKIYSPTLDRLNESFIVSSCIGDTVAKKATLSGAAGGCQAEIGTATAMASAGLTYFFTYDPLKASNAAALSLKSLMGLVCDPVGGFVEVPCVKRNGVAVNIAIATAEMAMAGIESVIPFEEVVSAMYEVGKQLPESLRETGIGGIAGTESAKKIVSEIQRKISGFSD